MSTLKVDTILKRTGTGTITLGQSGDTISIPSGATIDLSNATQTGVGGNMTPMFLATATTDQTSLSDNTATKRIFNSEIFDSNNAYDTSTGLFTVPTTGKYLFVAGLNIDGGGSSNGDQFAIHLSRDSDASGVAHSFLKFTGNYLNRNDANIAAIKSLNANETVGVYGRMQTAGGSWNMYGGQNINYFGGFKIIE